MTGRAEPIDIQCESCGAHVSIDGQQITTRCLFCDNPSVVRRPAARGHSHPVFAISFSIEREAAAEAAKRWIGGRKMAPFGLKSGAVERITGIYVPTCIYSATASTQYVASIAENYQKTGVRLESDSRVSVGSRNHTEYHDLTGRHVSYVSDVLVTASRTITNQELQAIEPFDLTRLRRYSASLVAGWNAEAPSLSPEECVTLARAEVEASIPGMLREFMPGDGVSGLRHTTEFQEESIDPTLTPVWVVAIKYSPRKPPLRILVNGQTGKVGGAVPFSPLKLAVLIAAGVAFLAVVVTMLWMLARPIL